MNMPKFEFANHNINIDVAGHTFTLDCSTETAEYMGEVSGHLREMVRDIEKGKELNTAVAYYCKEVIDFLLGVGATDRIFADRNQKIDDLTDVLMFLSRTVGNYQQERKAERVKPPASVKKNGKRV